MFDTLISCVKGVYTIRAEGRFPERILNIASTSGIYLRNVKYEKNGSIVFCAGRKGTEKLLSANIEGLSLTVTDSYGFYSFFKRHKKRFMLYVFPLFFLTAVFIFSMFIWRVEIDGGDKALQSAVRKVISENGVYTGALKKNIDHYEIKRKAILKIDDLSWMWVDIKGTTAKVKIRPRTPSPSVVLVNEPSDVVSLYGGVVEKMQVYCGVPLVKEGDIINPEQVIITGVFRSENENIPTYYHHATGNVTVRLSKEKTVIIPKKTIKKTPTGNKKTVFSLKSEKNNINFSLNSGISYLEYDKIERKYKIPLLPVAFFRTEYHETTVTQTPTDIEKEKENRKKMFLKELSREKMELVKITENVTENEQEIKVTFIADCRVRTDKEIPIPKQKGEANGKNS